MGVHQTDVEIEVPTTRGMLDAALLRPRGQTRGGVVLLHDALGTSDHFRDLGGQLANEGFSTIVPDLYSRVGRPDRTDIASIRRSSRGLSDARSIEDITECVRYLKVAGRVSSVVCLGFSAGGRIALLHACSESPPTGVIVCWAGLMDSADHENKRTENRPSPPMEVLELLGCPALLIGGRDDKDPTPETLARVHGVLSAAGREASVAIFEGAGHAFLDPALPTYRDHQARECWGLIVRTLNRFVDSAGRTNGPVRERPSVPIRGGALSDDLHASSPSKSNGTQGENHDASG